MSLNIKNEETHRLAKDLASLTGESKIAVRERLERVRAAKSESLVDRIMAISRESAAQMSEEFKSLDHGEFLYDERGLPR